MATTYHILRTGDLKEVTIAIVKHTNSEPLFFKRVALAIANHFDIPPTNVHIYTKKSSSMFDFSADVKEDTGKTIRFFNLTETKMY